MMPWSERLIAREIALQTFNRRYLMAVPNCIWTGHECDLLVVTDNLRLIDVEVKISRADLRADAKKEKWWHREFRGYAEPVEHFKDGRLHMVTRERLTDDTARQWPPKVWKHYYAMPREIWTPELADSLPSKASGILLLDRDGYPRSSGATMRVDCIRRATPDRDAKPIVKLTSKAMEALERQKAHTFLAGQHVFHDPKTGEPLAYAKITDVRSFWTATLTKIGVRYRRPYNMRHTYATIGLMSGAKPGFLAKQLGHGLRMFFTVYAKWISSSDDDLEMAKLDVLIEGSRVNNAQRQQV